jgi:hypothetical protein
VLMPTTLPSALAATGTPVLLTAEMISYPISL